MCFNKKILTFGTSVLIMAQQKEAIQYIAYQYFFPNNTLCIPALKHARLERHWYHHLKNEHETIRFKTSTAGTVLLLQPESSFLSKDGSFWQFHVGFICQLWRLLLA